MFSLGMGVDGEDQKNRGGGRISGRIKRVWRDPVWSKVIASGISCVIGLIVGITMKPIWLKLKPEFGTTAQERQITFADSPLNFEKGWQGVIVTIQPPPSSEETVQVWIQEHDWKWYPCDPATEVSTAAHSWMTKCRFGNPDSPKVTDHAIPGTLFTLGVFSWKENIPDNGGLSKAVWDAFKFEKTEHNVSYKGK